MGGDVMATVSGACGVRGIAGVCLWWSCLVTLSACGGQDIAPLSRECQIDGDCGLGEACVAGRCETREEDEPDPDAGEPPVEPATPCEPCQNDGDCGRPEDRCLTLLDGRFCGRDCQNDPTPCPGATMCDPVGDTLQCVPTSGQCADCFDPDNDGYGSGAACAGPDCAPDDAEIFEGAEEVCDGRDNDCDEQIDEGFNLDSSLERCGACDTPCAPPRAAEAACLEGVCTIVACETGRGDCDGDLSNGCESLLDVYFLDEDGDQYGRGDITVQACVAPENYSALSGDCDDDDSERRPGVEDLCDGVDNDCDRIFDEDEVLPPADRTEGVCASATKICTRQGDFVEPVYEAIEGYQFDEDACDGLDNDCDGEVDEGCDPCAVPLNFPTAQAAADARCNVISLLDDAPDDLTLTNPPESVAIVPLGDQLVLRSVLITLEDGHSVSVSLSRLSARQITVRAIDPESSVLLDRVVVEGQEGLSSPVTLSGFNITVQDSRFVDNLVTGRDAVGGAVLMSLARDFRMLRNVFSGNRVEHPTPERVAGAVFIEDPESRGLFAGNLFVRNGVAAADGAGAVFIAEGVGDISLDNNTFVRNTNGANIQASALQCVGGLPGGRLRGNIMALGTGRHLLGCDDAPITYSNHEGGQAPEGLGNISAETRFVDADADDYRLDQGSPCINTGDPDPGLLDLDNSRNDMGHTGGPFGQR